MATTDSINNSNERDTARMRALLPILEHLGYVLDEEQPHIGGERFLMSGPKLVLVGKDTEGSRVVIKASEHQAGAAEIRREKESRDTLSQVAFTNERLYVPEEIHFGEHDGFTIFITAFVPQDTILVTRPLEEQFFLILRAFEALESFHATTHEHIRTIKDRFPIFRSDEYLRSFAGFHRNVCDVSKNERACTTIEEARLFIEKNRDLIDRHGNRLTHTDFVPHNMRLNKRTIYLIDLASVQFGNAYEGWARFINYMAVHNPPLAEQLIAHIRSRGESDYLALRLMRAYKIGFLLSFYTSALEKTTGDLHTLTEERIELWTTMLDSVLADGPLPIDAIENYRSVRDTLRSEEEKERQREFAVA